jgi:hypothetical protein
VSGTFLEKVWVFIPAGLPVYHLEWCSFGLSVSPSLPGWLEQLLTTAYFLSLPVQDFGSSGLRFGGKRKEHFEFHLIFQNVQRIARGEELALTLCIY